MARARAVGSPVLVLTVDLAVVGARHRDTRNAMVGTRRRAGRRPAARSTSSRTRRWIRSTAIGGKPLTFGNLEKAVPGARTPGRVPRLGRLAVRPERDVGRRRVGARAVARPARRQGRPRRRRTRGAPPTPASTGSSSRTTAGASSTRCPRRRARCPRSPTPSATRSRCSPTAASAPALDVVKMVALGARAVLVGRAWAWAVAARGEAGVRHVLDVLQGRHRHRARPHRARRRSPTSTAPPSTRRPTRRGSA